MKTKAIIALLILAGALTIWFQFQTQNGLRVESELLRQSIARLQADNENLSNRLAAAADTKSLPNEQFNELLKLRGEVGVLHNQIAEQEKLRERNQQSLAETNQSPEITPDERFQLHEWHIINAMKELGLAVKIHAEDNNHEYATNFDQLKTELNGITNFTGNIGLDTFEFMNIGLANDTTPNVIIFRERVPRIDSNSWWYRVYGLADGSVQTVYGGDQGDEKKFEEFEKEHSPQTNQ
jgi:hypothetical protein